MRRFLFVCTGNTCRSPLAEAYLKHKRPDLEVKSAGVNALEGLDASEGTRQVLAESGITLNHASSLVTKELMEWADVVLTLTESHKTMLVRQYPDFIEKISTLKEFALEDESLQAKKEALYHHYSQLEIKQSQFLQQHRAEIDELNKRADEGAKKKLRDFVEELQLLLKEDREAIELLEQDIPSNDISDPFGGSIEVYRKTANEIEYAIKKLIERM